MASDAPLAHFKDLCIDALNPTTLGGFWSAVLALSPAGARGGNLKLVGDRPEQTVWVNRVPEAKSVKNRVHLDVEVGDVSGLSGLGASVIREPGDDPWWVVSDPEGGEFCAFIRDDRSPLPGRFRALVVDCADPHNVREWWQRVLGMPLDDSGQHHAALISAGQAPFDFFGFVPVPEPKTVKNRIHWDVTTPDVDALVAHGATMLREKDDELDWYILADPEGNEFCAFAR